MAFGIGTGLLVAAFVLTVAVLRQPRIAARQAEEEVATSPAA
jgi:hypothetical protein